jgi:hypothetical protein
VRLPLWPPSRRRSGGTSPAPPTWVRSAPDEKATPLPVMTAARTAGSSLTSWIAPSSAVRSGRSMALRFSGRFRRSQAAPSSSTSYSKPAFSQPAMSAATVVPSPSSLAGR